MSIKTNTGRNRAEAEAVFAFCLANPRRQPAWSERQAKRQEKAKREQVLAKARQHLLEHPERVASVERLLDDNDPATRKLAAQVLAVFDRDQRHFAVN
jgi:hypothetical protein